MVLSPLLIQGIEVNLPKTDTTKMSISSEPLVISIDRQGEYYINLGEEQLPISLKELKNKAEIIFQANPEIEIVFKFFFIFHLFKKEIYSSFIISLFIKFYPFF